MAAPMPSGRVRFGVFELDLRSGELRKHGIKIKLHDQPFKVLAMLLERPGEVVAREQLRQRLWPADTFVDFDVGLNSAIKKLRDALGESTEAPRYVETLRRRGYRFIGPVENGGASHGEPVQDAGSAADVPGVVEAGLVPAQAGHPQGAPQREDNAVGKVGAFPETTAVRRDLPSWPTAVSKRWLRNKIGIAAAVLGVLAASSWWLVRPKPGPYAIAVLPFKNLSSEPDSDYFSDGLTDEVIHNLSLIEGLQVKSRTSSFFFKDTPRNVHDVGKQLGVNLVVEGSVLRSSDKLRINAQLIRVSDDFPLWSGRFDRDLKDVFAIQDEISRSIVNELRLRLGRGQRRYNTNLEAYELYLKAQTLVNNRGPWDKSELRKSIELFEEVIAKDPNFAPAYAGIAHAYTWSNIGGIPPPTAQLMRAASEKALQLDPLLAEAYDTKGLVYMQDLAWGEAEMAFRRAIQLNPNLSVPREDFALVVLFSQGKVEEAVQQLSTALKLDPLSQEIRKDLALVLPSVGRYDEAFDNCRRVLAVDPSDSYAEQLCGRVLLHQGKLNEAIASYEKLAKRGPGGEHWLGYALAKVGRRAKAEELASRFPDSPFIQALTYGGLGDKDRAFEALERMAAKKDPRVGFYPVYPELALLRGDPRLSEFRRKLGLPQIP
jgi:TolB-like protein/DNA-binding winged helix-turn-helix (wHTH) protein/Tfp pilus assembly protein PilF